MKVCMHVTKLGGVNESVYACNKGDVSESVCMHVTKGMSMKVCMHVTKLPLHTPPPFSPSLISLMVSVDVKHHVYLVGICM